MDNNNLANSFNKSVMNQLNMIQAVQQIKQQRLLQEYGQQYIADPTNDNLLKLAQVNPQAANVAINLKQKEIAANSANTIGLFNTFVKTSPSQKKILYPQLLKYAAKQGLDISGMPLEMTDKNANEVNALLDLAANQARAQLSEKRQIETDIQGRKRFVDTGKFLFPEEAQQKGNTFVPDIPANAPNAEKADLLEQAAYQNMAIGNERLASSQMVQSRFLKQKEFQKQQFVQTDVEKLSKRFQTSAFFDIIPQLEKTVNILNEKEDVPGFGATGVYPDIFISSRGKELRQSVVDTANLIIQARGGKQITDQEAQRLLRSLGVEANLATGEIKMIPSKTDEQLRFGIRNTIAEMKEITKGIKAGYRPESYEQFTSNLGYAPEERLNQLNIKFFNKEQLINEFFKTGNSSGK